jgi:hypothetical protein
MPAQRQDYILGQIQLLREFVARLLRRREAAGLSEALQLALHLQEKLFGRPAADFLKLEVNEQLAALKLGESTEAGRDKCLAYATLLKETAALYDLIDRPELATGARQLALHVALGIAVDLPPGDISAQVLLAELNAALGDQPKVLGSRREISGLEDP